MVHASSMHYVYSKLSANLHCCRVPLCYTTDIHTASGDAKKASRSIIRTVAGVDSRYIGFESRRRFGTSLRHCRSSKRGFRLHPIDGVAQRYGKYPQTSAVRRAGRGAVETILPNADIISVYYAGDA